MLASRARDPGSNEPFRKRLKPKLKLKTALKIPAGATMIKINAIYFG